MITPSQWLMDKVDRSMLKAGAVSQTVIPNGVDTRCFKPGKKNAARDSLGLPLNTFILLFAAHGVKQSPWKDYATIEHAIKIIAAQNPEQILHMVAMGEDAEDIVFWQCNDSVCALCEGPKNGGSILSSC